MAALGLKNFTLSTVAAGAIRYAKGPERNFPARCFFFLREDVMKIKDAFEKYSVPVKAYSNPGEFIALRHAMKNYLGRDSGLADVPRVPCRLIHARQQNLKTGPLAGEYLDYYLDEFTFRFDRRNSKTRGRLPVPCHK